MSILFILFTTGSSLILLLLLLKFNPHLKILDQPNFRSSHSKPIPRTGGLAFIGSFFLNILFFHPDLIGRISLVAIAIIFTLGLFDDLKGVNANKKFFFIILGGGLLYLDEIFVSSLGQFFEWNLSLGWFSLPFTLIVIGGITNATNLIDGLDGLSGGVSLMILISFAYIGQKFEDQTIFILSVTLIATILPFLFFNYNPAKIFMGDCGSLSLGFIIALLVLLSLKHIHPVTILYLCAVPIIDTLVVMIRRIIMKKNPFTADKNHIHHILHGFFKSTKVTTLFIVLLQTLFSYIGYVVARQINLYPAGLLPIATVMSFIILILLNYIVFTTLLKNQKYKNESIE